MILRAARVNTLLVGSGEQGRILKSKQGLIRFCLFFFAED